MASLWSAGEEPGITVRESRAGDDFHVLWAARRALRLLNPQDPLYLLRIEGLSPVDAADDDDRFLGCDLTEYDGGSNFTDATAVRLVQLKYSTVHADKPWTAAVLAHRPSRGQPVIRRLAAMHSALVQDHGREHVLAKATVSLVSNRPLATELGNALHAAQSILRSRPEGMTRAALFAAVGPVAKTELQRLSNAAGLSAGTFVDFVALLDLSGCSADSRHRQLLALHEGVSDLVLGAPRSGVFGLRQLITHEVMPESAGSPGLRAEDVLAALGASGRGSLFPFPSDLRGPHDPVPTGQAAELANALSVARGPVLAHGNLGIGKTTTLLGLEAALPAGSHAVIFDCFADGDYTLPDQERHSYRALLQMANDVALRVGLNPVVAVDPVVSNGLLFSTLRNTLALASGLMPPGALLVIAVDAADNATVTARSRGEDCFVDNLWSMPVPDNVRVVMTARTTRRDDVRPKANLTAIEVELAAFDGQASSRMFRRTYPSATNAMCAAFHQASFGVARMQAYALGTADSAEDAITAAKAGLPAMFDDILDTAMSTTADLAERTRALASLAVAGRPSATRTLAAVLGRPELEVEALILSMRPALDVVDGRIRFADEDFDTHLTARVTERDRREAHEAFVGHLWPRRDSAPEAATHIALHLWSSGRAEQLVRLACDEGPPEVIADGFVRTRAYRTRVRLAMRVASSESSSPDRLQLLLAAADAARSDGSLRDTIRAAPDLATLHAEASAVAGALLDTTNEPWLGRLHLRAALVLAQDPTRHDEALEQLGLARAWLRTWSGREGRGQSDFDAEDLAHGTLAAMLLGKPEFAWQLATGWRPQSFVESVLDQILAIAPSVMRWESFADELDGSTASTVVKARAAVAFARAGAAVSATYWRHCARRLADSSPRATGAWVNDFAQLALEAGVGRATVRSILECRRPTVRYLDSWGAVAKLEPYLRNRIICELLRHREPTTSSLTPGHLAEAKAGSLEAEKQVYDKVAPDLVRLLGLSVRQSMAASGQTTTEVVTATLGVVGELLEGFRRGAAHRYPERPTGGVALVRVALLTAADSLASLEKVPRPAAFPASEARFRELLDLVPEAVAESAPSIWTDVARRLRIRHSCRSLSDELLRRAASAVEIWAGPPTERRDLLLAAARVALDAHDVDGRALSADLFERAVVIASGLDVDVAARLRCLLRLASAEPGSPQDADLAEQLVSAVEAATFKVDDAEAQLPHALTLQVATSLEPALGLAAAMRWSDEQRLALDAAIGAVAPAAVAVRALRLDEGFTLLGLRRPDLFSVAMLRSTAQANTAAAAGPTLARWVPLWVRKATVDAAGSGSVMAAQELRTWLTAEGVEGAEGSIEVLSTFERAHKPPERPVKTSRTWDRPRSVVDVEAVIASAEQEDVLEHLELLRAGYAEHAVMVRYLLALASKEQGGRVATLTFIAGLVDATPHCDAKTAAIVLRQLLADWAGSPSTVSWARQVLPDWTARHLPDLFGYVQEPDGDLHESLHLPSSQDAVRRRAWEEVAHQLEQLSSDQLLAAAHVLGRADVHELGRRQAVRWALARSVETTPPLPRVAQLSKVPFAAALLAALGHEDVRRRWLAARALRDHLAVTGDIGVAKTLLELAADRQGGEISEHELLGALPRPLTALQWLLIALSQVAGEDPRLLAPLAGRFVALASDQSLPHAAIRELARRAAEHVEPHAASGLLDDLRFANRPGRVAVAEPTWDRGDTRDEGTSRFRFSMMDTLPYWFSPLAEVFHEVRVAQVAEAADVWITDTWGRTWDADCRDDPRVLRQRDTYRLTSNDHGALPVIETAQTYLEYHAMMLVAGSLCDSAAANRSRFEDYDDPWSDWLQSFLPSAAWVGDARSAFPAGALVTGDAEQLLAHLSMEVLENAGSGATVALAAARAVASLDGDGDAVVVHGSTRGRLGEWSCAAYIESAIVNPEAVSSLISALRVVDEPFPLPLLGDEGPPWGRAVSFPSLSLAGWLRPLRFGSSIDDSDPVGFGPGVPERVDAASDFGAGAGGGRRTLRTVAWASLEYFGPERHGDGESRGGAYAVAGRADLKSFLAERGRCLIVVSRSRLSPSHRDSEAGKKRFEGIVVRVVWPDGREDEAHGGVRGFESRY